MTTVGDPHSAVRPESGGAQPSREPEPASGLSPSSAVPPEGAQHAPETALASGSSAPSRESGDAPLGEPGPASRLLPSSAVSRESAGPASRLPPSSAVSRESGSAVASGDAQELPGATGAESAPELPDLGLPDPPPAGPPDADGGHGSPTRPERGEVAAESGPVAKRVYYSIGEVGVLTGLKPHVLRYWETQFDAISPGKNRGGSRVYRVGDIRAILLVKRLLYEERFTIEGAKQKLDEMRQEETLGKESALRAEPAMLALIKEGLLAARSALALPEAPAAPSPD